VKTQIIPKAKAIEKPSSVSLSSNSCRRGSATTLIKARSAQSSIETNVNTPSVHHAARGGLLVAGRSSEGDADSVNFASLPGLTRYHFHSYPINTATTKANDPTIPTLIMNGNMNRNQRS
jgi:hypothetical protein